MLCNEFQNQLSAYLADELSADDWRGCEQHLSSCEDCTQLWLQQIDSSFNDGAENRQPESHGLIQSILEQTEQDPCQASEAILCDFVDNDLAPEQRTLLLVHLESCEECRQTADTLLALQQDLPLLAAIEPARDLSQRILSRTLPWSTRLHRHVQSYDFDLRILLRRSRFSLEASFAVTILLMTVFGVPTSLPSIAESALLLPSETAEAPQALTNTQNNTGELGDPIRTLVSDRVGALKDFSTQTLDSGVEAGRQNGSEIWKSLQTWIQHRDLDFNTEQIKDLLPITTQGDSR